MEPWLTALERHATALSSFSILCSMAYFFVKERDVYKRTKSYTNELWYNYCGERRKLFVGVENGAEPIIPPPPTPFEHGD